MNEIVYIEKTDIGATLTTFVYCAMWQLWAAEQQGKIGYINWPDNCKPGRCLVDLIDKRMFQIEANMYNWFFLQPKSTLQWSGINSNINIIPKRAETWTWENWVDNSGTGGLYAQPLSVIKDYYKKHLIFNDYVNARGQQLVDKYNIDFSKTIGITWRGTDNVTDGRIRMPIEKYFKYIDMALEVIPGARIMVTAEEESILDPLLARYPQAFNIDEFYSSPAGSLQNPERFSPMSGYERGLQPALMVWLFSKTAWYIKNRSSTGAVASWLSDGKVVCLAHSETLNYDKMDNEVEIEGKRYPL